jgi:hypothetical protein
MSLTARDRHALDAIGAGLAGSDPGLAGFLSTFTRLTAGEAMPAREQLRLGWRRVPGTGGRAYRAAKPHRVRRACQRLGPSGIIMLAWLLVTVVLVSLAVTLGTGSGSVPPCNAPWAMGCAQPAPAAGAHSNPS